MDESLDTFKKTWRTFQVKSEFKNCRCPRCMKMDYTRCVRKVSTKNNFTRLAKQFYLTDKKPIENIK